MYAMPQKTGNAIVSGRNKNTRGYYRSKGRKVKNSSWEGQTLQKLASGKGQTLSKGQKNTSVCVNEKSWETFKGINVRMYFSLPIIIVQITFKPYL